MEKINKKVERYLQLSKQFEKTSLDIFGQEDDNNIYLTATVNVGYTGMYSINQSCIPGSQTTEKQKSRAEKIVETAKLKAKVAEDYDEYLQLQKELGDYFTSLNKLTQ